MRACSRAEIVSALCLSAVVSVFGCNGILGIEEATGGAPGAPDLDGGPDATPLPGPVSTEIDGGPGEPKQSDAEYRDFSDRSAWVTFDLTRVDPSARSFSQAVFDGQYLYFVPFYGPDDPGGSKTRSGTVLRHDTKKPFDDLSAWAKYEVAASFDGARGFIGGVFDGRYVYLVPYGNALGTPLHGQVVRFDTKGSFDSAVSWERFDVNGAKLGNNAAVGFAGGVFDGRYVYLVPYLEANGSSSGFAVRFDTTREFGAATSWEGADVPKLVGEPGAVGFNEGTFDGRYVYFVPHDSTSLPVKLHGNLVRYDVKQAFRDPKAWEHVDLATVAHPEATGLGGAVFHGGYVYLSPYWGARFVRYDTKAPLGDRAAYTTWPAETAPARRASGCSDGRHVYFPSSKNDLGSPSLAQYDTQQSFDRDAAWRRLALTDLSPGAAGASATTFAAGFVYFTPGLDGLAVRFEPRRAPATP